MSISMGLIYYSWFSLIPIPLHRMVQEKKGTRGALRISLSEQLFVNIECLLSHQARIVARDL